jgi:uncharacterized protein (DUF302 family)
MKPPLLGFLVLFPALTLAGPAGVLRLATDQGLDAVYDKVHEALEAEKFWVVFEADMGSRMARLADEWGDDYNRNALEAVKSMVFCNIGWTNRIANADPDLLAMCPLHLSLYAKDGQTVIVMPRVSAMAEGSPGQEAAAQLEGELRRIIEGALLAD